MLANPFNWRVRWPRPARVPLFSLGLGYLEVHEATAGGWLTRYRPREVRNSIYRYRKIHIDYRSKFLYRFISPISIIYGNTTSMISKHSWFGNSKRVSKHFMITTRKCIISQKSSLKCKLWQSTTKFHNSTEQMVTHKKPSLVNRCNRPTVQLSKPIIAHWAHRCGWNAPLTHWGRDNMAAIFQTTFSNTFAWMKMYCMNFA